MAVEREWLARVDELTEQGVDPFVAVVLADENGPRPGVGQGPQLALDV